jgi:DNA-binding CsgD family transcriptional regulator/PAS domain-containing protein
VGVVLLEARCAGLGGDEIDDVLAQIIARGRRMVRAGDLFCRVGERVFALGWRDADEAAQTGLVARVAMAMRAPVGVGADELTIDLDVGTALSDRGSTAESLLTKAERSLHVMQAARRHGLATSLDGDGSANGQAATEPGEARAPASGAKRPATLVVDLGNGRVRHADDEGERLLGRSRAALVGMQFARLLEPSASTGLQLAFAALASGTIESFHGHCTVLRLDAHLDAWASARVVQVRDTSIAVVTLVPDDGRSLALDEGHVPLWQREVELAVGLLGNDLTVAGATSCDRRVEAVDPRLRSGATAEPLQRGGESLLSFVHADDGDRVREAHAIALSGRRSATACIRWFHPSGGWFDAELVLFATGSPRSSASVGFILSERHLATPAEQSADRIGRLERLLAHIASEARAAAHDVGDDDPREHVDWSRLDPMSGRQREVVKRLVMGERVPAIAKAMFISRSTVRNHLSSAFHLCGVKTQSELIELFLSSARDRPAA